MSRKKKILVVDDEQDMRNLLCENLNNVGYEAYQASNGEEGLLMAKSITPDLIISDIIMPKMDGNQFYKSIRAHDFQKKIPFIVMSARGKMRDYFEVVEVDDFIEKPFEFVDLAEKIEKLIQIDSAASENLTTFTFRRILVIGSDRKCVDSFVEYLKKEGWHPDLVNSGVQVISKAVLFLPVIMLIDVDVEDMSTPEIIKIIRTMPQFQSIPILLYSSEFSRKSLNKPEAKDLKVMEERIKECLGLGASKYIEKTDEKSLVSVVNRYLKLGILLVVDPNEEETKNLKIELEVEGAKVFTACSGKDGLKAAKEILPDLMLLNVGLKDMEGYEFVKQLKTQDLTKDIAIILYKEAVSLEKGEIEKGLNLGAEDYVSTPLNTKLLVKRIQSIVELKREKRKK